jgi:hypothetical protein
MCTIVTLVPGHYALAHPHERGALGRDSERDRGGFSRDRDMDRDRDGGMYSMQHNLSPLYITLRIFD